MYLLHIIEFMDMSDFIPNELSVHPNIRTPVSNKIQKSKKILSNLVKQYELTSTRDFVMSFLKNNN